MESDPVVSRLSGAYPGLPRGERAVVRVLLDDYPFAALGSLRALAERAGVSPPTASRLFDRLGYGGFADFQAAVRDGARDRSRLHEFVARSPASQTTGPSSTETNTGLSGTRHPADRPTPAGFLKPGEAGSAGQVESDRSQPHRSGSDRSGPGEATRTGPTDEDRTESGDADLSEPTEGGLSGRAEKARDRAADVAADRGRTESGDAGFSEPAEAGLAGPAEKDGVRAADGGRDRAAGEGFGGAVEVGFSELGRAADELRRGLDSTLAAVAEPLVETAAVMLAGARTVWALGGPLSELAAEYLIRQLASLRPGAHRVPGSAQSRARTVLDLGAADVVVAYDFRRYSAGTARFVQATRSRGARLVLVTDAWESPLAAEAEVLIRLPREAAGPIAPLAHEIAVTELLLVATASRLTPARRLAELDLLTQTL
ncbi:MurR/RpiR family transcriptional regulator [Nonomuraea sp. K274]|uniref:MurR/RpiR family transcriptional regulator n=1 Tax=Nonomuraea cypriaca TaxID=1187855 RepID=A0A931AES0_9ACTN|nr:SIS domain-containing protein [Nonomuraea cypriaca]MBF8190260.1 MurR/RpiR family transcriptional regulator [Nonomuraea cypriaca]